MYDTQENAEQKTKNKRSSDYHWDIPGILVGGGQYVPVYEVHKLRAFFFITVFMHWSLSYDKQLFFPESRKTSGRPRWRQNGLRGTVTVPGFAAINLLTNQRYHSLSNGKRALRRLLWNWSKMLVSCKKKNDCLSELHLELTKSPSIGKFYFDYIFYE